MTIYVDKLTYYAHKPHGHEWWCHMISDHSEEELHAFAAKIGLKRSWFQDHHRHPHYDLTQGKRNAAINHGAQQWDTKMILWENRFYKKVKDDNTTSV